MGSIEVRKIGRWEDGKVGRLEDGIEKEDPKMRKTELKHFRDLEVYQRAFAAAML